jgi:hypothetical protein
MIDEYGEEWSVDKKCDALEMELNCVLRRFIDQFCNLDEELTSIGIKPHANVPFSAVLGILDKIKLDFFFENRIDEEGLFSEDP